MDRPEPDALSVCRNPSTDDIADLRAALVASRPDGLRVHREPLGAVIRDDDGHLVAGVAGYTQFAWLCITELWVSTAIRGEGRGSKLLLDIEEEARGRGCVASWLDTYSFQARPFYERHGYSLFGRLEECPAGHTRYFLTKELQGGAHSNPATRP